MGVSIRDGADWVAASGSSGGGGGGSGGGALAIVSLWPVDPTTVMAGDVNDAVDEDNFIVSFTAPASGAVLVYLNAVVGIVSDTSYMWGVREQPPLLGNTFEGQVGLFNSFAGAEESVSRAVYIDGITPGDDVSYIWTHHRASGSGSSYIAYGELYGPATMAVFAVPS